MRMPEGVWRRETQEAVLLIFCPPLPEPVMKCSWRSCSRMLRRAMRCWSASCLAGEGSMAERGFFGEISHEGLVVRNFSGDFFCEV